MYTVRIKENAGEQSFTFYTKTGRVKLDASQFSTKRWNYMKEELVKWHMKGFAGPFADLVLG